MLLEPRDDGLAALVAIHAGELAIAIDDDGVLVEDVDLGQVVRLAHGVVVGIVCGRHLDEARAKARVHVPIGEDRNLAVHDGKPDHLAHELLLVWIIGG